MLTDASISRPRVGIYCFRILPRYPNEPLDSPPSLRSLLLTHKSLDPLRAPRDGLGARPSDRLQKLLRFGFEEADYVLEFGGVFGGQCGQGLVGFKTAAVHFFA